MGSTRIQSNADGLDDVITEYVWNNVPRSYRRNSCHVLSLKTPISLLVAKIQMTTAAQGPVANTTGSLSSRNSRKVPHDINQPIISESACAVTSPCSSDDAPEDKSKVLHRRAWWLKNSGYEITFSEIPKTSHKLLRRDPYNVSI